MDRTLKLSNLGDTKRTFSKYMTFTTFVLGWLTVFTGIYLDADAVAISAITLIGAIAGVYMGVGHMDYRSILTALKGNALDYPDGPMGSKELEGGP